MKSKLEPKLIAALLIVAIVWGTTYLGIRVAVQTIPPWFVTAIRQGIAAIILLVILLSNKQLKWIGWKNLTQQMLLSTLMIVLANGMTTLAEQSVPSGLTSLLNALSPIAVFLGSVAFGLEKRTVKGFLGVIIGFSGVAFIFKDGLTDLLDPNYSVGIFCIAIAILAWTSGTIYTKKYVIAGSNILLNLFYQFSFACLVQFVLAFLFSSKIDPSTWSLESFASVVYLGVFGSVVGYVCYSYALKKVTATEVSILSYFNTIIALFLGWLILDEVITIDLLIATALIILGVFITNYRKNVPK
jgi:drug/metabolite transporter (DMT)-like permease